MKVPLHAAVAVLMLLAGCGAPAEPLRGEAGLALDSIAPAAIAAHVRFLAADDLGGRGTGTAEYRAAAEYVADAFARHGLAPAGAPGSFYQEVPLLRAATVAESTSLAFVLPGGDTPLEPGQDYVLTPDFHREAAELVAPVVLVGFGVVAPALGHDDYAGADVSGKIVAFFDGGPPSFPPTIRAHHGSRRQKLAAAAERGAVGALFLRGDREEARAPWERIVRQSRSGSLAWLGEDGRPRDAFRGLLVQARLSRSGLERLLAGAPLSLAEALAIAEGGSARPVELPVRLAARTTTRHELTDSPNVAGLLPGGDPALADQVVVVSAHLDHLGRGEPLAGDDIYNGAYDNASGIAVMLESARALAALPGRPRRPLLFLAVTGEEHGLLGSDYFAHHPTVTPVADLNVDMVLMLEPLAAVIGYGAEHSSLGPALEAEARQLGLAVLPDPVPDEAVFARSDQYSFVRQGIPALYVTPAPADEVGVARFSDFLRNVYHTPVDDAGQPIDFETGADFTRLLARLAWSVADADAPPSWNAGDPFAPGPGQAPAR